MAHFSHYFLNLFLNMRESTLQVQLIILVNTFYEGFKAQTSYHHEIILENSKNCFLRIGRN
jgi:hypothetical protein